MKFIPREKQNYRRRDINGIKYVEKKLIQNIKNFHLKNFLKMLLQYLVKDV